MEVLYQTAVEPKRAVEMREHGLDALRVFAFLVLILYHSGMGYVSWPWHVKNPEHSRALEYLMLLANRWRLPLLFFISGAGVSFSLRRRTLAQFAGERMRRLFIPLAVGMLVVVPPQIYLERLTQQVHFASYWDFYRTVFHFESYPRGNFSWHHLWFVAYVLIYALASIPVFRWLRSAAGRKAIAAFTRWIESWGAAIYLINIPNLAVGLLLGPHWPTTNNLTSDWANLTGAWLTFLWGFIFASDQRLLDVVTRRRREFLSAGLAMAAAYFGLRALGVRGLPIDLASAYFGLTWILFLIGYARAWIRSGTPLLRYATEAVYPFYIIHQTITVALVYSMVTWHAGVWLKAIVAAMGTFLGSWIFFELVRRVRPLRPLFGLKWG